MVNLYRSPLSLSGAGRLGLLVISHDYNTLWTVLESLSLGAHGEFETTNVCAATSRDGLLAAFGSAEQSFRSESESYNSVLFPVPLARPDMILHYTATTDDRPLSATWHRNRPLPKGTYLTKPARQASHRTCLSQYLLILPGLPCNRCD